MVQLSGTHHPPTLEHSLVCASLPVHTTLLSRTGPSNYSLPTTTTYSNIVVVYDEIASLYAKVLTAEVPLANPSCRQITDVSAALATYEPLSQTVPHVPLCHT
jgi:hypothetical protein